MKKIEERISEIIFKGMGHYWNHQAAVKAAKEISALISQVECGEQHDKEIRGLWCRKVDENKTGDWEMFNTKDGLYQICQTCNGTGYRKVVVRREDKTLRGGAIATFVVTPFTPDDLLDVIEGTATLELEEEG